MLICARVKLYQRMLSTVTPKSSGKIRWQALSSVTAQEATIIWLPSCLERIFLLFSYSFEESILFDLIHSYFRICFPLTDCGFQHLHSELKAQCCCLSFINIH